MSEGARPDGIFSKTVNQLGAKPITASRHPWSPTDRAASRLKIMKIFSKPRDGLIGGGPISYTNLASG